MTVHLHLTNRPSIRLRRTCLTLGSLVLLIALTGAQCVPNSGLTPESPAPQESIADASAANPPPPEGVVARVVITPGAALLTGPGQTAQLSAQLLAADGGPLPPFLIEWKSSDESIATVDANGLFTAVARLGSAQITATCGGVTSMPIIVLIAQPADGAMLVTDEQVVGDPTPIDPNAEYGLGYRYSVSLNDMPAPQIGQILLGTGGKPIGGRVVSLRPDGDITTVTIETVAAKELFAKLQVKAHADLDHAPIELPANIAEAYEVISDADATMHFLPKPQSERTKQDAAARTKIKFGPFDCTDLEDIVASPVSFAQPPVFSVNLRSSIDFDYDTDKGGFQKLILIGEPRVSFAFSPVLTSAASATFSCKAELLKVRAPIGGPLALLISPLLVVEAGFEISGGLTIAQVGFEASVDLTAKTQIGVDCSGVDGCKMVNTFDPAATPSFKPILPDLSHLGDQLALNVGLQLFGAARFKIGNPFLSDLAIEFVKVKAGPAFDMTLFTAQAQADDASKRSSFKLDLKASAGLGDEGSINEFLDRLLSIRFAEAKIEHVIPLAESPKGTFTITPDTAKPGTASELGDVVLFNATMNKSTFLGIEAIDGVEFFHMKNGRLEPGRPQCSSVNALPGQTVFTCRTDFLEEDVGEQTYYAFYKPKLFGIPLPFPIEINDDAKATVNVVIENVSLTVSPSSVTLHPGQQQQFTATVTGDANAAITWSATGGTISHTGLFTAGNTAGTFVATATTVAGSNLTATATILVSAESGAIHGGNRVSLRATTSGSVSGTCDQGRDLTNTNSFSDALSCQSQGATRLSTASSHLEISENMGANGLISSIQAAAETHVSGSSGLATTDYELKFRLVSPTSVTIQANVDAIAPIIQIPIGGASVTLSRPGGTIAVISTRLPDTGNSISETTTLPPGFYTIRGECFNQTIGSNPLSANWNLHITFATP